MGLVEEGGAKSRQRLDRRSGTDDLVGRQAGDRSELVVEEALLGGAGRLLETARRELVEFGTGQTPLGRDELGADALGNESLGVALGHSPAERVAARKDAGAHRYPRHGFDARGDYDVVGTREHALRGETDGLLAAPALPVDGGARDALREAGSQERVAGDVECLIAHLGDGARDDVVDVSGVDAGTADDLAKAVRE